MTELDEARRALGIAQRTLDVTVEVAEERIAALEQECRDRECTEMDVRARLADAENALAKVRAVADRWAHYADYAQNHSVDPRRPRLYWDVAARKLYAALGDKL